MNRLSDAGSIPARSTIGTRDEHEEQTAAYKSTQRSFDYSQKYSKKATGTHPMTKGTSPQIHIENNIKTVRLKV